MWWLVVFFFIAPLVGAVALWRGARPRLAATYYVTSTAVPPLAAWLSLQHTILTADQGPLGSPALIVAVLWGVTIWITLMIVGVTLAAQMERDDANHAQKGGIQD